MPDLVRLYLRQTLTGFGVSALFVAALLVLDVAGLGSLVARSADGPLAVGLVWLFNGIVFSGVQFGIAVMSMAEREGPPRNGGSRLGVPVPVRVDSGVEVRRDHH
ncbi:hypothetical protein KTJ87_10610 [Rhodobacteraceae bacterium ASV31]|uniref:hypothetical protein n=1 Tax=Anianabacter salinae TaxID=2851023 RepID=UPI00225E068B|nr:hypothetical protein [Anianabacter salinae]MBV0912830.1 hypothetical protein [Anianabacter salinae]